MPEFTLPRRLAAEAIGAAFLLATVVGSGVMATNLTRDVGIQLLANALPTGAILVVMITLLGPVSGAHLNPAVTLVFALRQEIAPAEAAAYAVAQTLGAALGVTAAHLMFGLPPLAVSATVRTGAGQWFAEFVAAFGLLLTVLAGLRFAREKLPVLVGLYIVAAYWFTASTSFANPAVTLARTLTDSFAGIRPTDAPAFILAQIIGALAASWFAAWLLTDGAARREP